MATTKGIAAIKCRALTESDWPVIAELFGSNGACGGCWCMYWRLPRGGKLWDQRKGRPNRDAFRRLIQGGKVRGALAFAGDQPVGWCCVGPRGDFPRLERSKALVSEWDEGTWSVTCFYIPSRWRGRGVATKLLAEAVRIAKRQGADRLEGYPVVPKHDDKPVPGAFAWTGVTAMFERADFSPPPGGNHVRGVHTMSLKRSRR